MPEILPPYSISELPQTSSKLSSRASTSCSLSKLYLGISHSSLAIYSLKSTPKLLWTHAISPVTEVLSVLAVNIPGEDKSQFLYYSTLSKYGTGSLRRILIKSNQQQNEDQEEDVILEKTEPIIDIRASIDGKYIYLLFKNGDVQGLAVEENGEAKIQWTSKNSNESSEVIFHNHLTSGQANLPEDGILVTVLKDTKSKKSASFFVRMIALDESEGRELINNTVKTSTNNGVFALHQGSLLHFDPHTFSLSTYTLPHLVHLSTIQVRRNQKTPTEKASVLPVGTNRILLSYDSTLKLVDTKYNTILFKRVLDKPIQLAAFSIKNSLAIGFTGTEIISLPVEPGTGSLLESLGKGVTVHDGKWDLVHSSFVFDQNLSSEDFIKQQTKVTEQQKAKVADFLNTLFGLFKKGLTEAYENWAIAYLKNEEWTGNAKEVPKIIASSEENLIYDASNDREVDSGFISTLVGQIFASKNTNIDQINPADLKLPNVSVDRLLVYLLTHPLFPTPKFPSLLTVLSPNPRFYRQAIVTAPSLSSDQVVSALHAEDDETFKDAITRLSDEFGSKIITKSIKSVFKSSEQEDSHVTIIVKLVERMQRLDIGWSIMSNFIDAGGLFAWDEQAVTSLKTRVDQEIEDIRTGSDALAMLEEALKQANIAEDNTVKKIGINDTLESIPSIDEQPVATTPSSKSSKTEAGDKETRNGPALISAHEQTVNRLSALLSFNGTNKVSLHKSERLENLERSVPPYTIEKLIL